MKERPILFSAPMVRALLDGSKTQTRRVVKPQPIEHPVFAGGAYLKHKALGEIGVGALVPEVMSYGSVGDRLWVKETFFAWGRWETRFSAAKGRDEWHFIDQTFDSGRAYRYVAIDEAPPLGLERQRAGPTAWWWKRPAIFMPRAASRIDLGVTGVRVERLQDISDEDASAEGTDAWRRDACSAENPYGYGTSHYYRLLWEQINGAGSWSANPWVWVVEFRRIRP